VLQSVRESQDIDELRLVCGAGAVGGRRGEAAARAVGTSANIRCSCDEVAGRGTARRTGLTLRLSPDYSRTRISADSSTPVRLPHKPPPPAEGSQRPSIPQGGQNAIEDP
jgi:hypothetical protein